MTGSQPLRAVTVTAVQVLVGLMWLYNIAWKRPPDFGRDSDSGLYHFGSYAVSDPLLPPFSWLVEHLVLPHIVIAGWAVLVVETALAVALLTGTRVRAAAVVGALQSLAIGLCVAAAPREWPWSYWLMVGVHLMILVTADHRVLSADGVRRGRAAPRALALSTAAVAALVGALALARGGAEGFRLGSTTLSISLGTWTRWPAVALLLTAVLLVVGSIAARRWAGGAVALLAAVAGTLVVASGARSIPWAEGDNTSAGALFAVAAVGLACALGWHRTTEEAPG